MDVLIKRMKEEMKKQSFEKNKKEFVRKSHNEIIKCLWEEAEGRNE